MTINNNAIAAQADSSYESFEQWWARRQLERGLELASRFSSVKEAFEGYKSKEDVQLLARILHPEQKVIVFDKTGSCQVEDTDGLPKSANRESYGTVRYGTVYYFHASTLKEGATVEWGGKIWRVLMNYLQRGSGGSLAYQCLYLLEVASVLTQPQQAQ